MYAGKIIPVVNLPLLRFVGRTTKKERIVNMDGAWYPEIFETYVTELGVILGDSLEYIVRIT